MPNDGLQISRPKIEDQLNLRIDESNVDISVGWSDSKDQKYQQCSAFDVRALKMQISRSLFHEKDNSAFTLRLYNCSMKYFIVFLKSICS